MPQDDTNKEQDGPSSTNREPAVRRRDWRDVFTLPGPIRRTFDQFPLVVYQSNDGPLRAPWVRKSHALYIFTTPRDSKKGAPSFNPSCLKWQVYLKSCGIDFHTVPSNNHASPSGALPFLLPQNSSTGQTPLPVPSNKLQRWTTEHSGAAPADKEGLRSEAYLALLDHRIRRAWLYLLYVQPDNFEAVAKKLYVQSASSSIFVNTVTSHQLCSAALTEIHKTTPSIAEDEMIQDGQEALSALSTLLGSEEWFFGSQKPGMFDASVFAYTHLLLDDEMGWKVNQLGDALRMLDNLVSHRDRLLRLYFE